MRHRKAPYTIAGPDRSPARLVLHMRRKAGKSEDGGKKYSLTVPLLSLSSPLPIHPSFPSQICFYSDSHPFLPPLPFHWPLSSGELKLWHVPTHMHSAEKQISENTHEREGSRSAQSESSAQISFEKKKAGMEGEEPAVNPTPPLTHNPSLRFGYAAPLLSVKQAF